MPRRRPEDDDDDDDRPRRRRRREEPRDRTLWIVGGSLAAAAVVIAVLVVVLVKRGRRGVEEVEGEGGVRITTVRSEDGSSKITMFSAPADGRPYGMRHDDKVHRPDAAVLTEAWGMLKGRWERTDEKGDMWVAEFRDDYTATVSLVYAEEGFKTSGYKLKCVTDHTGLIPRDKSIKRAYTVELRLDERPNESIQLDCHVLQDGTLAAGYQKANPYRRVR